MIKIVDGVEIEMTTEEIATWKVEQASIPSITLETKEEKRLTKVYKSTFIMRCEEEEIIQLLERLSTENVKFREMYNACDFFSTTDSMYAVLHCTVADELGEERANELLEPEA